MPEIDFDTQRQRLTVGRWSARATWVRPATEAGEDDGCSAVLGLRRGVNLLIVGEQGADKVLVELWAGEPEESDGLAVTIAADNSLIGIARIPLCGCGERGCGNVGLQFATQLTTDDLPVVVEMLRATPDVPGLPRRDAVWRGEFRDNHPVGG